jgi:hypothetical protein
MSDGVWERVSASEVVEGVGFIKSSAGKQSTLELGEGELRLIISADLIGYTFGRTQPQG